MEIGIGVLVSAISAYCIFPNHLKDNVASQLQSIFADFSTEFKLLLETLGQIKPDFDAVAAGNLNIKRKIRKALELIGALNHELGVTQAQTDEIRALLDSFYNLSRQLQYLILISPQYEESRIIQSLNMKQTFHAIEEDLQQLQRAFTHKERTAPLTLQTPAAINDLEQQLLQSNSGYIDKNDFIYSLIHFLQQIERSFAFIQSLLMRTPLNIEPNFQVLKIQDRLRTDPDLIKRSIKAGLSVILALGFWFISNWPGGLNGIISSLIISLRKNLFEMKNVSIHRLIGCFSGGSVALITLYVTAMDLYDFIIVIFCAVWAFTYFMFKYPKYAYIGLQANIALIISLAQEGGPPLNLAPPLQRLGGIVIGIFASFIVANLIWRSDVWSMLNRYLNKLYYYSTYNLRQVLLVPGNQKTLHELANLFWISRSLLESLADESISPKKQKVLTKLNERFASLVMIQATLSHILVTIDCQKVQRTAQFLDCDLNSYVENLVDCFEHHDTAGGMQLSHHLLELLAKIGSKTGSSHVAHDDFRAFLAYLNALNQLAVHIY